MGASVLGRSNLATAQKKTFQVGLLLPNTPEIAERNPRIAALMQGFRDAGLQEGSYLVIQRRFAHGQFGRLAELAVELVKLNVDVIVTAAAPSALAAKNATGTIPIVMLDPGDPVGLKLVESLARPGGNVTGVSSIAPQLAAKRLQLLKEAIPKVTSVAVVFNTSIPPAEVAITETQSAARDLGIHTQLVAIQGATGLDAAFGELRTGKSNGLIVIPDPLTFSNLEVIVKQAAVSKLPALYGAREFVEAGGLMSYGPDYQAMFRRGAYYVQRILKGAKPAELPVELPTKFELLLNMQTARALGITFPRTILVRADRVIE